MITRVPSFRRHAGAFSGAALLALSILPAHGQSSKSQAVYLPDPTPREKDPLLLYGDNTAIEAHTQQSKALQNERRLELIQWGANELVLLSARLQANLTKHSAGTPLDSEAADAEKIEQLARNLKAAVKAQ